MSPKWSERREVLLKEALLWRLYDTTTRKNGVCVLNEGMRPAMPALQLANEGANLLEFCLF